MCLALPGRIVEFLPAPPAACPARVAFGAVIKTVDLSLLPEANLGDYVIVHAGVAISVLDQAEAEAAIHELSALEAMQQGERDALRG